MAFPSQNKFPVSQTSFSYRSNVQTLGSVDRDGDYDIVYYNADIINGRSKNSIFNEDPIVSFKEARNVPIINDTTKFEFSIIRFQLNGVGKNLPLMIPQIAVGADNPYLISDPPKSVNFTTYTFGLSLVVGGLTYYASRNLIYEPENLTYLNSNSYPRIPTKSQDLTNDYYYIYTYDHFVKLVNKTFNLLRADLVTLKGSSFASYAPFMTYDAPSGLFSIYYDTSSFGITGATEEMNLYSNNNSFGLFGSFDTDYINPSSLIVNASRTNDVNDAIAGNKNEPNIFRVYNKLNTNIWLPNSFAGFPTLAPSYYKMTENFVSTSSIWSPIQSIVFTSGQLPVVNESISAPIVYGTSNDDSSNTSAAFSPIIADLAVNMKRAEDYSNFIYYEPQGEFKMASMIGGSNGKLTDIDIQVYYKNRLDNKLYPIRMFNYSSVSMKMLFRKRLKK